VSHTQNGLSRRLVRHSAGVSRTKAEGLAEADPVGIDAQGSSAGSTRLALTHITDVPPVLDRGRGRRRGRERLYGAPKMLLELLVLLGLLGLC
jgi:hypothetical protein